MLTDLERIRIADIAARRYRRLGSIVDEEETLAAALLAVVEEEHRIASLGGDVANVSAYVMRGAQHAARDSAWASVSPVTHKARNRCDIAGQVTNVRRASDDDAARVACPSSTPEDETSEHRFRVRFHRRVLELCATDPQPEQEAATRLAAGDEPGDVARELGIEPAKVYRLSVRLRTRIQRDAQMRRLHEEHVRGEEGVG